MEMSLFDRDGKTWTRFKIKVRELPTWKSYARYTYGLFFDQPVKKNSRFIYYEAEGDYLNWKKGGGKDA